MAGNQVQWPADFRTVGKLDNVREMHRHKRQSCVTDSQENFYHPFHRALDQIKAKAMGKNVVWHPGRSIIIGILTPLVTAILLLISVFNPEFGAYAQGSSPTEHQLKAAFLYNFAKFIDWPPETFVDGKSPFVIGILGDNPFGNDLEHIVAGKKINDRPIMVQTFHTTAEATNCQILFISNSEKKRFVEIIQSLRGHAVLTVSETDRFIESGGMVNFVLADGKIRFQISDEAAKAARLKISSKLLSLAISSPR